MEKILKLECIDTKNLPNKNFFDPNLYPHNGFFLTKNYDGRDIIVEVAYKNKPSYAVCFSLTIQKGLEDYFKDVKDASEKKRIIHNEEWIF